MVPSAHQRWGAALIHPDQPAVIPLRPAPIIPQDGATKNDGERNAAKRFIAKLRQDHPLRKVMVTEDSLRSHAPQSETFQEPDLPDMLGVQEGDQACLFKHVVQAEQAGRGTADEREDRQAGVPQRLRFVCGMPRNESKAARRVHCIACWETVGGKVQHGSWVPALCVHKGPGYRLMQGARARWHIAHDTCKTLKNPGYHVAHHVGHGSPPLSVVFAALRMWACGVDQVQQLCGPLFQAAWAKWGRNRWLWEKLRALGDDDVLGSMRQRLAALVYGLKKSAPTLVIDSS